MTDLENQRADGITLLGSEMLTWSDFDGEVGAFRGRIAPRLLHSFASTAGRVLVAGPTSVEVIADLARRFESTDVLVRSWLDAKALRTALDPAVRVFCGPLDRMPLPERGYDAVVAVAGLDRLHSAEEDRPSWVQTLDTLAELLSERGELYLGVGNDVGLDRLLSLSPDSRHRDADWPEGQDPGARVGLAEVTAHLSAELNLARVETWACHGRRGAPAFAAAARTILRHRDDPVMQRLVGSAYAVRDADAPALKDPVVVAADLVRAGLGAAVAPMSVLHLRRGAATADETPDELVFLQEVGTDQGPARGLALRLEFTDGGWRRSVVDPVPAHHLAPGALRDPATLTGPVPGGSTLAELLARNCAINDISTAGEWVRRYRDWLAPDPAGEVAAERVATRFSALAAEGTKVVVLDPSVRADAPAPVEVVLLRALLDFCAELLARGGRHPWEPSVTPAAMAAALAAATGIEVAPALHRQAVELDRMLRPTGSWQPEFEAAAGGGHPASYAELVELVEGLARRASEADAHIEWLLRNIQARQRTIRRARGGFQAINESREYRVGRRIFWIRDLLRRWKEHRRVQREGRDGEWKTLKQRTKVDPDRVPELEEDLIPPGYEPDPGSFEVIESLGDDRPRKGIFRRHG